MKSVGLLLVAEESRPPQIEGIWVCVVMFEYRACHRKCGLKVGDDL
jgi:hypothetical protein